jgi:N-acyl homoserine lactone hydrolase
VKYFLIFLSIFTFLNIAHAQPQDTQPTHIKLYAMECGRIDVSNFSGFSDTGDYENKSVQLIDPCFLIVHPKGILLWDTGLSDSLIKKPETMGLNHLTKSSSMADNLKKINLTTNDITFVAVSHSHFDHMGTLDQFPKSKWILNEAELKYAKTRPFAFVIDPSTLKNWKTVHKNIINSDYDVFGDGTVQILSTHGHTPGHQSLMIKLPQSGVVILSGDEFHQRASFEPLRVPVFNTSRADTMASADRIKGLIKNNNARLVVQHDSGDFEKLPKFPGYLD